MLTSEKLFQWARCETNAANSHFAIRDVDFGIEQLLDQPGAGLDVVRCTRNSPAADSISQRGEYDQLIGGEPIDTGFRSEVLQEHARGVVRYAFRHPPGRTGAVGSQAYAVGGIREDGEGSAPLGGGIVVDLFDLGCEAILL